MLIEQYVYDVAERQNIWLMGWYRRYEDAEKCVLAAYSLQRRSMPAHSHHLLRIKIQLAQFWEERSPYRAAEFLLDAIQNAGKLGYTLQTRGQISAFCNSVWATPFQHLNTFPHIWKQACSLKQIQHDKGYIYNIIIDISIRRCEPHFSGLAARRLHLSGEALPRHPAAKWGGDVPQLDVRLDPPEETWATGHVGSTGKWTTNLSGFS